jgi:nitrogen fixation NifU-like protein
MTAGIPSPLDGLGEVEPEQEIYRENILDHYRHPRNKRALEGGVSRKGINPSCGDTVTVYVRVADGKIVEICYTGDGCAISQATTSILTEELLGKTIRAVTAMQRDDIRALLGIPIGVVRMKCAMLGLRTIQGAIAEAYTGDATLSREETEVHHA